MVSGVLRVGAGVILEYPRVRIRSGIRFWLRAATPFAEEASRSKSQREAYFVDAFQPRLPPKRCLPLAAALEALLPCPGRREIYLREIRS